MTAPDAIALADVLFALLVLAVIVAAYVLGHREGYAAALEDLE